MTLLELSAEYRAHAAALKGRIEQLRPQLEQTRSTQERKELERRIHMLSSMQREAMELAALTEHYYDRGYHSNARYKL